MSADSRVQAGTGRPKPPNAGKGRKKGVPNKVTADIREAIRQLLEQAAPLMPGWLERVAKDDPAKALDVALKAAEYAIPKLSRAEIKTDRSDHLATALKEARERVSAGQQQRWQQQEGRRDPSSPSQPQRQPVAAIPQVPETVPPPRLVFDEETSAEYALFGAGSDDQYRPF